jgi:hypothetical protein
MVVVPLGQAAARCVARRAFPAAGMRMSAGTRKRAVAIPFDVENNAAATDWRLLQCRTKPTVLPKSLYWSRAINAGSED